MMWYAWNALRAGDRVLVHEQSKPSSGGRSDADRYPLRGGTVAYVEAESRRHQVGIRLDDHRGPTSPIVWPSPLTVHLDPAETSEPCWRCETEQAAVEVRS